MILLDDFDYQNVDEREREEEREEDVLERCDRWVRVIEKTEESDRYDGNDQEYELVLERGLDSFSDDFLSRFHCENGVFISFRL